MHRILIPVHTILPAYPNYFPSTSKFLYFNSKNSAISLKTTGMVSQKYENPYQLLFIAYLRFINQQFTLPWLIF